MKRRFPAFFLALALCLGLAVPAFAADKGTSLAAYTYISPASGEDYPYVNVENMEFKRRALNQSGAYGEAQDTSVAFVMVAPAHEYFNIGVYNLAKGEENKIEVMAYTDHDGDGIYDMRIFQSGNTVTVLPIPKNGVYDSGDVANWVYAYEIPGFTQVENGNYAFSAASLYEFFGDNTVIRIDFGDEILGWVWLCAGAFDDVPGAGWYSTEVAWAAEKGIAMGTGEGEFSPGDNCTHIQILTFLSRAAGNTKAGDYDWATEQSMVMDWAKEKGMIDDSFDAQKSCNRAEAVNYIWQAKGKPSAQPSSFTDMDQFKQYMEAVNWAYQSEVTKGEGGGIFNPGGICSRAHIATFLYRAYNN